MIRLQQIIDFLRELAPPQLAESWDNVGLLVGDANVEVNSVLTCLTLTGNVADEAIAANVQLIVSHHPVLFRAVQRLTAETAEGRTILSLIRAGINVYSPHTGYDSAADGINAQLARLFELQDIRPLRPINLTAAAGDSTPLGSGRWGRLPHPLPLSELLARTKTLLRVSPLQFVGDAKRQVTRLGIACGAAAEFLHDATRAGCEALLTGEARFHACLEAEAANIALVLPGHYATERPAMERLAEILHANFPSLHVQASTREFDPVQFS